jgi:hypothetical protein
MAVEKDAGKRWDAAGPDLAAVQERLCDPLRALAEAEIPAIVLRASYPAADCERLVARFIERGLMDDPSTPGAGGPRRRIDIGTSLGNRGSDKEGFLSHAAATHDLFAHLFDGLVDPVAMVYGALQALALAKRVVTAYEPDGRRYGPAIFRVHYTGHRYKPHIDHVTLRERRFDYAVTRFSHQFAGVLCVQNSAPGEAATQSILHRCVWTPEVQPHIEAETFDVYARENGVAHVQVDLEPGDLYFFNTRLIHEVPALAGTDPRIVLAVFIGYSPEDEEIFVWS